MKLVIFLLPFALACNPKTEEDDSKGPDTDNQHTDTGKDGDTGEDDSGGEDSNPRDLDSYDEFVPAHARAYCDALTACGYYGEGYTFADAAECDSKTKQAYEKAGCESYSADAAKACLREDAKISEDCAASNNGAEPKLCRDVCKAAPE